ncbi:50S ribosomal protein L4 [Patescibacteria group bacterium]|nr:50S ribosomal protein L4 [Patescibacteria group bacterium]
MKVDVLDIKGNKVKDINLSDTVFKVVPNKEILGQYLRVYLSNQRQGTSHTKTRAEVSGGGKKPWRQKGTGRARHGSTRSPIWVGGGTAHGPRAKSWSLSLSKEQRRAAMRSAISQVFVDKKAVVVDEIKIDSPKTKDVLDALASLLSCADTLIVWKEKDENLFRGCGNIPNVYLQGADNLNVYDLLKHKKIILVEDAAKYLEGKYKK